jgi:DNA-binding winged helix-turn-helix (wHTH) protein
LTALSGFGDRPRLSSGPQVRFGSYFVDFRAAELYKAGHRLRLQEQPFKVLTMLLERPGEIVTREELREQLWPADTFVDFNHGLNSAVARLREALYDSAEKPKYIDTVARRGYRFIGTVEKVALPTLRRRLGCLRRHPVRGRSPNRGRFQKSGPRENRGLGPRQSPQRL